MSLLKLHSSDRTWISAHMTSRATTSRRIVLVSIAAITVLANIAYFLLSKEGEPFEFVLELLNTGGTLGGDRPLGPLPLFDGQTWSIGGEPVGRLEDHLLDTSEWTVPHTFGKIMLIELPDDAGAEAYRAAVASLAVQGICQVAAFQEAAPVAEQGLATAVRVRRFLDANGHPRECIDRVNGET